MLKLIEPKWSVPKHVIAFTTTRLGGFSTGNFASLNMGSHVGDDAEAVAQNRAQLPFAERLRWLKQVHSDICVELTSGVETPVADAAVSSQSDFFCAVMTADCIPILLSDEKGTRVAAIHAGWQGLLQGVIARTVRQMQSPPQELLAWIGPGISQSCYEVDLQLAEKFKQWPQAVAVNSKRSKAHLNLPLIAQQQLMSLGIASVYHSELCTYTREDLFFSHRRAQHQNHTTTGRMVTVIGLT